MHSQNVEFSPIPANSSRGRWSPRQNGTFWRRGVLGQVKSRGVRQALNLVGCDRLQGASLGITPPCFDLDKNQPVSPLRDQVDFTLPHPIILLKDFIAFQPQISGGLLLPPLALLVSAYDFGFSHWDLFPLNNSLKRSNSCSERWDKAIRLIWTPTCWSSARLLAKLNFSFQYPKA